jgi:transposase
MIDSRGALGVDDIAPRRAQRYATMVIDAITHRRVDVLPDRKAATRRHRRLRRAQVATGEMGCHRVVSPFSRTMTSD